MAERGLPSGFVTFVFTDVEGSTRLLRRLGDRYPSVLARHFEVLGAAWDEFGGTELNRAGDSCFVAFAEPGAAIAACVDAQRRLADAAWPRDAALSVRMGIHAGLASPRDGDYVALAVHQAARVMSAAHGGQILVSADAARGAELPRDVALISLGRFRLRDFDDPPLVYGVSAPGFTSNPAPPRAVPLDGHNLVAPSTPFVGRDADVRDVVGLVRPGRVVTLTGPGGVGKTRLAVEVGLAIASQWTDGVWFVDFATLRDAEQIGPAVAGAIAVKGDGRRDWRSVVDHLRDRHALLILDNCEHLVAGVAQFVDDVLAVSPTVGVLATSRERLSAGREHVKSISPLAVPELDTRGERALQQPAVRLFVDRARTVRPDLSLGEGDIVRVALICRRLDGLPLALELAAGQLSVLTLAELVTALDDRFALLRSRDRRRPDRQRTMEAVLEWGRDLLTPDEQVALRRLGAFRSGFTLETATAAIAGDEIDPFDVPELVWALADKSFVVAELTADETRYRLLDTVRAYAMRLLHREDDAAQVARRLATWWLERIGPMQPIDRKRTGRIAVELDNLLGLVDLLVDHDDVVAQEVACTIGRYYYAVETFHDSVEQLERFVAALPTPSDALTSLMATLAHLYVRRGDVEAARHAADRAEELQREVGAPPPWDEVAVDRVKGEVALRSGDYVAAVSIAAASLQRARDARARGRMLNLLGMASHFAGDTSTGDAAFAEELDVARELGDEHLLSIAEGNLAEAALRRGDTAAAAGHQLACLRLAVALGAPASVAYSLVAASRLVADADADTAARLHAKADTVLVETEHVLYEDDRRASEAMLGRARDVLGDDTYRRACDEGRALTLVDAAAIAERVLSRIAGA